MRNQFAEVKMIVEGGEPGSGRIFEDKIKGGNIPKEYIPGVEKGVEGVADTGVIAGFPIIDYKVTLIDGNSAVSASRSGIIVPIVMTFNSKSFSCDELESFLLLSLLNKRD